MRLGVIVACILFSVDGDAALVDIDNDRMPDVWETAHGLVVGVDDSDSDKDGDGRTNWQEYSDHTDPGDSASRLALSIQSEGSGDLRLGWVGGRAAYQDIEVSESLGFGARWRKLQTKTPPTTTAGELLLSSDRPQQFYRIKTRRYPTPPNIVLIVADDLGWGDVGYHGSHIETPNIDSIAAQGIQLDRFYTYAVCSRTRSALMTGRSTTRLGTGNRNGLPLAEHTMAETFDAAGYQTWTFGKWHLGGADDNDVPEGPEFHAHNRGFDYWYGHLGGAIDFWGHFNRQTDVADWWRGEADSGTTVPSVPVTGEDGQYSSTLLTDAAIAKLRSRDPGRPVFLYLPYNAIHGPTQAPQSFLDKYDGMGLTNKQRQLAACCDAMDQEIGRLLTAIDAEGMRENTLVFFMSDNGGQLSQGASNLPLNGEKGTGFEGGVRVPAAVRWLGVIDPGQVSRQLVWVGDLFPSLCSAVGVAPQNAKPFDGVNLWSAIRDNQPVTRPPMVTGNADKMVIDESAGPMGPWWKLLVEKIPGGGDRNYYLFDVSADPYETNDLWDDANPDPSLLPRKNALEAMINAIPTEY